MPDCLLWVHIDNGTDFNVSFVVAGLTPSYFWLDSRRSYIAKVSEECIGNAKVEYYLLKAPM